MEPIWLKHYPQGVPAEADISRFSSLKDMLEQSCGRYHELPAFTNMGITIS
jgi:long-chain acyl-CoA synthetase